MTDRSGSTPAAPDFEGRLRHAMGVRAGHEPVTGADWGDLAGRISAFTRRRQRLLASVAGAALLVGAAGGFLGEAAASTGTSASPATPTTPSTTAPLRPGSAAPAGGPSASATGPDVAGPCMGVPGTQPDDGLGSATHVFTRITVDGVTVRAYRLAQAVVTPCNPTGTTGTTGSAGAGGATDAPATTTPVEPVTPITTTTTEATGSTPTPPALAPPVVSIELSDDDAVGQGVLSSSVCVAPVAGGTSSGGLASGAGVQEPQQLATGTFGVVEGDPVWWVAVDVGADVASVRMTFPDGSVDQMVPVDGVAVVARHVTTAVASSGAGPLVVRGTLDLLDGTGAVLATVSLPETSAPVPVPLPAPASGGSGSGSSGSGAGATGGSSASGPSVTVTPAVTTTTVVASSNPAGTVVVCPPETVVPEAQSPATTENR